MANSALPGANPYNFSSALPDHYVTALPVGKAKSKSKENSSRKTNGSPPSSGSSPVSNGGYSTALPRVKQTDGRHQSGRNGYQPLLSPIPQFSGESSQAWSNGLSPGPAEAPPSGAQPGSHGHGKGGEVHFATALPRPKPISSAATSFTNSLPHTAVTEHDDRGMSYAGHTQDLDDPQGQGAVKLSPGSRRMPGRMDSTESQLLHNVKTIYNTFWGQSLTFHPFVCGDTPPSFSKLWPDRRPALLDAFKEAELDRHPYEVCKLLLATNSHATLDALVEGKVRGVAMGGREIFVFYCRECFRQ